MGLDSVETRKRILSRLGDETVREALADVFLYYVDDLHEVLNLATVENGGIRPEGLANELYACFHHLARGLSEEDIDPAVQFLAARKSHLKRATLDSYKIALNEILTEDAKMREILDYLVLVEDFERYIPDGLEKVTDIKDTARSVKKAYRAAKHSECCGQFSKAIESFNSALAQAYVLREKIEVFTRDKTYLLACAREAHMRREKSKDRKVTVGLTIIVAILASVLTLGGSALVKRYVPSRQPDKGAEARSSKNTAGGSNTRDASEPESKVGGAQNNEPRPAER